MTPHTDTVRGQTTHPKSRNSKTHPKSRNTPKNAAFTRTFRRVSANFCLLPCDMSQEPGRNCSEKLVQMNFLLWGGFFSGGFPPQNCTVEQVSSNMWSSLTNEWDVAFAWWSHYQSRAQIATLHLRTQFHRLQKHKAMAGWERQNFVHPPRIQATFSKMTGYFLARQCRHIGPRAKRMN